LSGWPILWLLTDFDAVLPCNAVAQAIESADGQDFPDRER
jgi:hypothetical protein